MPPKQSGIAPGGMQKLLERSFIGNSRVSIDHLEMTTVGRAQRQSGIKELQTAIRDNGFIESFAPLVCLPGDLQGSLLSDIPSGTTMRVIDGNHRVAALKANDEEAGRPPSTILVRVHNPMESTMMKMVAEGGLIATSCCCTDFVVFTCCI